MWRRLRAGVTATLWLAFALPAGAQPRPAIEDPEGTIVEELVVVARERGPAWWRVSDGDTTVYILGVPGTPLPPGVAWDRSVLETRMKGAHSLVMGTSLQAGVKDIPALLKLRGRLKTKTPMEDSLPPALQARFLAARDRVGKPAARYSGWQPVVAGQLLVGDAYGMGKRWASVEDAARKAAKRSRAPVRTTSKYPLVPFLKTAIAGLTPQVQAECLEGAVSDVEAGVGPYRRAAEGWARGDVGAALNQPRAFDKCLLMLSGGAALWRTATRDNVSDIATALKTPGHAVAVINLRRLLAEDGVVEQLEARGLRVVGPGEAG